MRLSHRFAVASIAGAALLATALPSAQAITGGEPDGDGHPAVARLLFYADDGEGGNSRYRCTGSLVADNVILTAGHCTDGQQGQTLVFFDHDIVADPNATSSDLPTAAPEDGFPAGSGVDDQGRAYVSGHAYTHPNYSNFTDMANWNDVGVIVLDQAVTDITPMEVAPVNYLDDYGQPTLNSTPFTFVGYGTEVRKPDAGPQKPTPMSYPLIRRVTDAPGQKLTPQILQVNGNPNDNKGDGGTCFGDSGGPGLLNGFQVTVTSYGYTSNCRYLDGHQRVDIPIVLDWLRPIMAGVEPGTDPLVGYEGKPGKGIGRPDSASAPKQVPAPGTLVP